MTQGELVRNVRKSLSLTLEEFGNKIGLKKSAMSCIENGKNALTGQNIKAICREYNVNLDYLISGEGDMFTSIDAKILARIDYLMTGESTVAQRTFKALAQLSDEEWLTVEKLIDSIAAKK